MVSAAATCPPKSAVTVTTIRSHGCNQFAGVDYGQRVGIVAALEVERLALGAVGMNHLTRVQGDPNTRRRATASVSALQLARAVSFESESGGIPKACEC